MSGVSEEEIERLANRLGMLVSDGGEADNAGRAVGALARRLGLTGGQLKAIFMAGAESAAAQSARVRRLEREIERLRERLEAAEAEAETLRRERDGLSREGVALQAALDAQGRSRRMRRLAVGTIVLLAAAAAALVAYGPKLRIGDEPVQAAGAPVYHTATVHDRAAALRRDPDAGAPVLAMLPPGTRLVVHRMIWRNLTQWVEVGEGETTGFVLSTEVDLS